MGRSTNVLIREYWNPTPVKHDGDDYDDDDGDVDGDGDDDVLPVVVAVRGKAEAFAVYIYIIFIYRGYDSGVWSEVTLLLPPLKLWTH